MNILYYILFNIYFLYIKYGGIVQLSNLSKVGRSDF